jgi:hypothetical protein
MSIPSHITIQQYNHSYDAQLAPSQVTSLVCEAPRGAIAIALTIRIVIIPLIS